MPLASRLANGVAMRSLRNSLLGTIFFVLFIGPGPVGVLVPWLLSAWQMAPPLGGLVVVRFLGVILILLGALCAGSAFWRFADDGRGTPAPVAAPDRLVVTGLYRFVRNPMYIGMTGLILGQGLLLGNLPVLAYAAAVLLLFELFVHVYEEPRLRQLFGSQYEAYCRHVPRWIPRLSPWHCE